MVLMGGIVMGGINTIWVRSGISGWFWITLYCVHVKYWYGLPQTHRCPMRLTFFKDDIL